MADLSDEDYRAIARAALTNTVEFNLTTGQFEIIDGDDCIEAVCTLQKDAQMIAATLNGRAAVAEYEKRRAKR